MKNGRYVDQEGTIHYYKNDKLHRTDGPAVEWSNGTKGWYINGKLHRTDGPAVEWSDGYKEWYINGERYTEDEFKKEVKKRGLATPEYFKNLV